VCGEWHCQICGELLEIAHAKESQVKIEAEEAGEEKIDIASQALDRSARVIR
jgi:hypothetical protein